MGKLVVGDLVAKVTYSSNPLGDINLFEKCAYSFNSSSLGYNLTIIFLSLGLRVLIFILGEFPSIKYC